jgi:hypothetical protein
MHLQINAVSICNLVLIWSQAAFQALPVLDERFNQADVFVAVPEDQHLLIAL